ncbi:MAG: alpha-galactosidase [Sphaerochaetaceae bacterium]|nr:alpha-galactosidase [Sphaerochaetaceae bacterium]
MRETRICIIGGGSRLWAINFMKDLALNKDVSGTVVLHDIDPEASRNNVEVGNRMLKINGSEGRFVYVAEDNLEKALVGAELVLIAIEPGITECRHADLCLPEEYGILQSVGDTTGPGGLIRARRALPLFFDFARAIKKVCPDAWVINYTNPMTLCTAALYKAFPEIKAFGCCHEVFHTEDLLCSLVEKEYGVLPNRRELRINLTGVNHFTFITGAWWQGHDLMPLVWKEANKEENLVDHTAIAKERIEGEKWFDNDHLVAYTFLRRFGVLGAAGDRHLAEFVPWFLTSDEYLNSLGVVRTPYSWRVRVAEEKKAKTFTDEELVAKPSGEEGVDIMMALLGDKPLKTNMNRPNEGQITYLPKGRIVESLGYLSQDSVVPIVSEDPPLALQNLIRRISDEQEIALEAIWEGDDDKLFEAFLLDPLMCLSVDKARELFDRMCEEGKLVY